MAGLVFLAFEINQNTEQMRRAELNATHEHKSSWRHTIMENSDLAGIWQSGLSKPGLLSPTDQMRFDMAMEEVFWSTFHFWDRASEGVIPESWIVVAIDAATDILKDNPGAKIWWEEHKGQFDTGFTEAVDQHGF